MDIAKATFDWLFIDQPVWVSNVANLMSFTFLGAILGLYRRYDCDQSGCVRLGIHRVPGTTYRTCTKHATLECYMTLKKRHAIERPEQHKAVNSQSFTENN